VHTLSDAYRTGMQTEIEANKIKEFQHFTNVLIQSTLDLADDEIRELSG